jgi:hypothetical protein
MSENGSSDMSENEPPQPWVQEAIEVFNNHFASATRYGERWQKTLFDALGDETRYTLLYNRYTLLQEFRSVVDSEDPLERVLFPSAEGDIQADNLLCFTRGEDDRTIPRDDRTIPAPALASNGLALYANFEAASVLAVHILQVVPGDNVLHLGANVNGGPGIVSSNSIILAQSIWPSLYPDSTTPPMMGAKKGILHSAGLDTDTNESLTNLMARFLPTSIVYSRDWRIAHVDGTRQERENDLLLDGLGGYDKVLVDVPSTTERYITQAIVGRSQTLLADELQNWSPISSMQKAEDQVKLLMTALMAVRVGGRVVYTTNSISDEENDGVVEKAFALIQEEVRNGALAWTAHVELLNDEVEQRLAADWAEQTANGWMVLPDHAGGGTWGPRYISVLTKKNTT